MHQISEIDIFYSLNFIFKFNLEKSFQIDLTKQISSFFSEKGVIYLTENFKEKKIFRLSYFNQVYN